MLINKKNQKKNNLKNFPKLEQNVNKSNNFIFKL